MSVLSHCQSVHLSVYLSMATCFSPHVSSMFLHAFCVPILIQSLGQLGRVNEVFDSGDCKVHVNGYRWTLNPKALIPAPGETPPDVPGMTSLFGMIVWNMFLV